MKILQPSLALMIELVSIVSTNFFEHYFFCKINDIDNMIDYFISQNGQWTIGHCVSNFLLKKIIHTLSIYSSKISLQ